MNGKIGGKIGTYESDLQFFDATMECLEDSDKNTLALRLAMLQSTAKFAERNFLDDDGNLQIPAIEGYTQARAMGEVVQAKLGMAFGVSQDQVDRFLYDVCEICSTTDHGWVNTRCETIMAMQRAFIRGNLGDDFGAEGGPLPTQEDLRRMESLPAEQKVKVCWRNTLITLLKVRNRVLSHAEVVNDDTFRR